MAGRIPQSFIDELVTRVDIVEVIDERVPLKKGGKDHKACCPFHNEKTPSFTVSREKQFYHCFGCGAHGTALGFLMDYHHMSFVEAVEELAHRTSLEVPRTDETINPARRGAAGDGAATGTPDHGEAQRLYEILEEASLYFQNQLRRHPTAPRAVAYLKARGLTGETAARFKLGLAPEGWDNLLQTIGGEESKNQCLAQAGLLVKRGDDPERGYYDRFRDRIIFPIHDQRGRTIGFGGRVIDAGEPKYLNSPETPVFHKGRELYGLYEAREARTRLRQIMVVEGYTDVLALVQHSVPNVVASLGTATTKEHLERLFRSSPDVVFCFDGDEAGRRAAWRALETALVAMRDGRQAFFMFLPEGEDPDSLVRFEGSAGFLERVENAASLSTFMFEHLLAQVDTSTIDGRSRLASLAHPLLDRIPEGAFRTLAEQRLSELTGIAARNSSTLSSDWAGATTQKPKSRKKTKSQGPSLVRKAVTLLVHYPELGSEAKPPEGAETSELPGISLLGALIENVRACPHLTTGALLERFRDHESARHLARLASEAVPPLSDALREEFRDSLGKLEQRQAQARAERRLAQLAQKEREKPLNNEERRELARLSLGQSKDPAEPEAEEASPDVSNPTSEQSSRTPGAGSPG